MAWTEQAWRHSLAGLPDPSQVATEDQWRYALGNVALPGGMDRDGTVTPTLGGFTTALAGTFTSNADLWDYDESLTLTITPLPDTGFDVTTRYSLANVPAVNLTDSIDRDGSIAPTLGSFVTALDGTHEGGGTDGDIATTIDDFNTVFVGTFTYRHYFDIAYSITPIWVTLEQPANFGDLLLTLDSFNSTLTGYALPADSTQGSISSAVGSFSTSLAGTLTPPHSYDGRTSLDIASFSVSVSGSSFDVGTSGLVNLALDSFSAGLSGTFDVWNTDGELGFNLAPFDPSFRGQSISAGANFGIIEISIAPFVGGIIGTSDNTSGAVDADLDGFIGSATLSGKVATTQLIGKV